MTMQIECSDMASFYSTIETCIKHGYGFRAKPEMLTIYLTGDF